LTSFFSFHFTSDKTTICYTKNKNSFDNSDTLLYKVVLYIRKHFNKTDVKFELINIPLFVEIRQVITGLSKTNLLELKSRSLPTLIINYEPIKNNFIKLSTSIFCFGDQYSSPPCLQRKKCCFTKVASLEETIK
jgi:hypothetical protein